MLRRLLLLSFLLLPVPAFAAGAQAWNVNPGDTHISFTARQMGTKFEGVFQKWTPQVWFDPDHLDTSHVIFDFGVDSLGTGDKDRDTSAATPEWFDAAKFPVARFEAKSFKKTGDKTYEAEGTLTIKGVSVPVNLPFTLDLTPMDREPGVKKARVKGSITLDRSKFGLGTGQWADTSVIANEVTVVFDVTAHTK